LATDLPSPAAAGGDRYSRQVRVAGIGAAGQARLRRATVLVVGCGALGTHAIDALARAGVGELWLVDRDIVEWSNLQRQVLFTERDARDGIPKAAAAAARVAESNGDVVVRPYVAECSAAFLRTLPRAPDLVLDGTDNFPTRYLLNDWCHQHGVPWIYAGAVATEAAAMVITPDGPCLRCLWPHAPETSDVGSCETAGILAPAIAAVSAFQVAEALKILIGAEPARGVFTCDVWRGHYTVVPVGGQHPALSLGSPMAVTLCGRDAVQIDPAGEEGTDLVELAHRLDGTVSELMRTPHLLRFVADGCRWSVFPGGRTLLFGVRDPLRARALYDRWIGRR